MSTPLPPWAAQTERGLTLTLRHQLSHLQVAAGGLGIALFAVNALLRDPYPPDLVVCCAIIVFFLPRVLSFHRILITLGDEHLEVEGRLLRREDLQARLESSSDRLRRVFALQWSLILDDTRTALAFPGLQLSDSERRWLTGTLEAWSRGDRPPHWPLREVQSTPQILSTPEPGRQTIVLDKGPLTLRLGSLLLLPAVSSIVLVGLGLFGNSLTEALTAFLGARFASGPVVIAWSLSCGVSLLAFAYLASQDRSVTLQIRQEGLTLIHGASRCTVALADVRSVEAVRRTVHSELVLALADGSTERVPVRGLHVATTLAATIREAQQAAVESREEAEEAQQARAAQRHAMQQLLERQELEG